MISLAFLLLAQVPATLSLAQVREMSPMAAGATVLRDQQHGPIETFETPTGGMLPPGMIQGQLVERPTASGMGCTRKRWTVTFRAAPEADIGTATVDGTYSTQEIALSLKGVCPTGRYVHLNPGVSEDQGWEALARLRDINTGASRTSFRCSDETSSGLCKGRKAVRLALRTLTPWAVSRETRDVSIWLGVPGGMFTEARFNSVRSSQVIVTRRVPAPF